MSASTATERRPAADQLVAGEAGNGTFDDVAWHRRVLSDACVGTHASSAGRSAAAGRRRRTTCRDQVGVADSAAMARPRAASRAASVAQRGARPRPSDAASSLRRSRSPSVAAERERLLEALAARVEPAGASGHVAQRGERVRLEQPLAGLAVERDALFEHGARLLRPVQPRQGHAEAVEDQPFLRRSPARATRSSAAS